MKSETTAMSTRPEPGTAVDRRRRRRLSWLAIVVVLLAVALPAIGVWNPWNLVVVYRALFHPALAGIVIAAALCWLCHVWVSEWLLRIMLFPVIGFAGALWALAWLMLGAFESTPVRGAVASPFNDVEVRFRVSQAGSTSFIWLRADRGLLSRENEVGAVVSNGSGAPALDARFIGPDLLVVTYGGKTVYRVRFDPRDLDPVDMRCRTIESPLESTVTSCLGRPAG